MTNEDWKTVDKALKNQFYYRELSCLLTDTK